MKERRTRTTPGWLAALVLIGCTAPDVEDMVPADARVEHRSASSLSVVVTMPPPPEGTLFEEPPTPIAPEELAEAVKIAVVQSRLFSAIAPPEDADYELCVDVRYVRYPRSGDDMEAAMDAQWTLRRRPANAVLFDEQVLSHFEVDYSSTFSGYTRKQLTTEGVARENLKSGIEALDRILVR